MKRKHIYGGLVVIIVILIVVGCVLIGRPHSKKKENLQKIDHQIDLEGEVKQESGELPILKDETTKDSDSHKTSSTNDTNSQDSAKSDSQQESTGTENPEQEEDSNQGDSESEEDTPIELPFVPY